MGKTAHRIDAATLTKSAAIIKCLGHPLRLALLEAMEQDGRTVTELQEWSGATQALVSQQLATLRGHGVVRAEREGQYIRYFIAEPKVHHILDCIRDCGA